MNLTFLKKTGFPGLLIMLILLKSQLIFTQPVETYNKRFFQFNRYNSKWVNSYSVHADQYFNAYVVGEQQTYDSVIIIKYNAAGTLLWKSAIQSYGGPYSSVLDSIGNLYVIYRTSSTSIAISKVNTSGIFLWTRAFAGVTIYPLAQYEYDYLKIGSTGIYAIGYTTNTSTPDYVLIRLSTGGLVYWQQTIAGESGYDDIPRALVLDKNDNAYITGSSYGAIDYFNTVRVSAGLLIWSQKYYGNIYSMNSIDADNSGNIYICGEIKTSQSDHQITLIKYSASGSWVWTRMVSDPAIEKSSCERMKIDGFGDIVISGNSIVSNGRQIAILKYNPSGVLLWLNRYSDYTGYITNMSFGYAGDIYVLGGVFNHSPSHDAVLLKYNKNGSLQWSEIYDSPYSNNDWGKDVFSIVDRNTGTVNIFTTLHSRNSDVWDPDIVTIRYTEAIPTATPENNNITDNYLPVNYELRQNYPNPFNPKSRINFEIPNTSLVSVKVYDILGKEAAVLVDASMEAGYYSVEFDGTNLSSGVYFYRIEAKDESTSKSFTKIMKMILVK